MSGRHSYVLDGCDYEAFTTGRGNKYASEMRTIRRVLALLDTDPREKGILHTLLSDMRRDGRPFVLVESQYYMSEEMGGIGGIAHGQKYMCAEVQGAIAALGDFLRTVPQDVENPHRHHLIVLTNAALDEFDIRLERSEKGANGFAFFSAARAVLLRKPAVLPEKPRGDIPEYFFSGTRAAKIAAVREAREFAERKEHDAFWRERAPSPGARFVLKLKELWP